MRGNAIHKLIDIFSAIALVIAFASHASAHAPYFEQEFEMCKLGGDKQEFQMRLLKGDGIFGPDQISVVIVNSEGKMVAFHGASGNVVLLADQDGECAAFDVELQQVFMPNAQDFTVGDVVVGNDDDARGARNGVDGMRSTGVSDFGLVTRPPSFGERWLIQRKFVESHLLILFLTAGLSYVLCWAIVGWIVFLSKKQKVWAIVAAVMATCGLIVFGLFGFSALAFFASISFFSGIGIGLIALGIGIGLLVFWAHRALWKYG